jgi:hypothetical protein
MTRDGEHAYRRLADELADRGVTTGQMFGKPTLKFGSKALACLFHESMAFKLGAGTEEHTGALALSGAELFDPSGTGRAMKDWVCVPVAHADRYLDLAEAARSRLT